MADPVYLTRLEIENVRCFAEQQVLGLTTPSGAAAMWTTILGENGTGKTTLLKVLALGATFDRQGAAHIPKIAATSLVAPWVRDHLLRAVIRIGVDMAERPRVSPAVAAIEAAWSFQGGGTSRNYVVTRSAPPLFGYGASRLPSSTSLGDVSLRGSEIVSLMQGGATLLNAEEWLLRLYFDRVLDPGGPAARQYDAVRRALIDILPDVREIPDPRGPDGGHRPGDLKGRVRFVTPDGEVAFDDLSLGYQTMTAWVVDLAARLFDHYPDSPDPMREPAIVLVDEIDLHLHPRWQRDLVRWLRAHFPRVQFVVTAHSPLVVQASEDANVVVLRRSPDGASVLVDNDPEIVRGWRVDQILTSSLYDLESARSKDVEDRLSRRQSLAAKKRRTKKEQAELDDLDAWAEALPTADRPEDQQALDVLRQAAALLVGEPGER